MNSRAAAATAAVALVLAGCAAQAPAPDAFAFAVMGDAPYNAREEPRFEQMIEQVGAEDVAFVVHVGDTKGGGPCTDALYARRLAQFNASRHPFIYTPGDNEWTECADALGRLALIRRLYFPDRESLGRTRMTTEAQDACLAPPVGGCGCGALPENRAWSRARIGFVTLHIVGENDGLGISAERDVEVRCRREANRRWLDRAVDSAIATDARALVVFLQADPWFSTRGVFDDFLGQVERCARRLGRPLLLVHGDTHTYRVDYPFAGVTRLETYGSPFVGWVKVSVDPGAPIPFSFDGRLVAIVGTAPRDSIARRGPGRLRHARRRSRRRSRGAPLPPRT